MPGRTTLYEQEQFEKNELLKEELRREEEEKCTRLTDETLQLVGYRLSGLQAKIKEGIYTIDVKQIPDDPSKLRDHIKMLKVEIKCAYYKDAQCIKNLSAEFNQTTIRNEKKSWFRPTQPRFVDATFVKVRIETAAEVFKYKDNKSLRLDIPFLQALHDMGTNKVSEDQLAAAEKLSVDQLASRDAAEKSRYAASPERLATLSDLKLA